LEAKNRKESIEQSIVTAKAQKSKAVITSPVNGKIDEIYPNSGEMASLGSPFARVVNTADVYVNSDVSEALYYKVQENDAVVLRLLDAKNNSIESKVIYKGNYINPANRTFKIHSELKGLGNYPPNMLVAVKIIDTQLKDVYTVPRLLIQTDSKGNYVYEIVSKGGKKIAQKLHVNVVQSYGGKTVIESNGITKTTEIVNHGYKGLNSGTEVNISSKK
jgi:multidrug efflux pump subunit AcrA (membrane-fusion protein)